MDSGMGVAHIHTRRTFRAAHSQNAHALLTPGGNSTTRCIPGFGADHLELVIQPFANRFYQRCSSLYDFEKGRCDGNIGYVFVIMLCETPACVWLDSGYAARMRSRFMVRYADSLCAFEKQQKA